MEMTPDVIGTIIAFFGAVATLFGGSFLLMRRLEARIDTRFDQVDKRFEQVDKRFDQADKRMTQLESDIRAVAADVVELKISVARIEGTPPTLLRAR
jgi:septal ring factor EnvC (AmiA/AmiB activator)